MPFRRSIFITCRRQNKAACRARFMLRHCYMRASRTALMPLFHRPLPPMLSLRRLVTITLPLLLLISRVMRVQDAAALPPQGAMIVLLRFIDYFHARRRARRARCEILPCHCRCF